MDFDKEFSIISEGVTDQVVLENILFGWTGNKNLSVTRLQPKQDEPGNWDKVFKYCQSEDFKGAFAFTDFLIIQIDTDFMGGGTVPEEYFINVKDLSVEDKIIAFRSKFIELIGKGFYNEYKTQIIFAISVEEIECWFLPIYFPTKKTKAAKIVNCIGTLNPELQKKEGFTISSKDYAYYEKIAKHFRKKKDIQKYAPLNESFSIFIRELNEKITVA